MLVDLKFIRAWQRSPLTCNSSLIAVKKDGENGTTIAEFDGYSKLPGFIDDLIKLCLPVYHGETTDITDGSVYYYSPKAQADLMLITLVFTNKSLIF